MWGPDGYFDAAVEEMLADVKARSQTREESTQRLIQVLGGFPHDQVELQPRLLESIDCGDYVRERVVYRSDTGLEVPAYVLIPKSHQEQHPAVIAWHGHGYGSREVIGLSPDGSVEVTDGIQTGFAIRLVRHGLVVLVPEVLGFGDRRLKEDRHADDVRSNSCFRMAARLLLLGKTLAGLRAYEAIRAVDYLQSRPDVINSRVGTMGFSGGGLIAALLGMLDCRVHATVVSSYTSCLRESIMRSNHCLDNYVPSILTVGDLPALMTLIAPRGLFVESGIHDRLFPVTAVETAIQELRHYFERRGCAQQFDYDLFPGGHEICGRQSFGWLHRQLQQG